MECRLACDPPNYAAACPNMFLSHFMDNTSFSILHIIDGKLLGERLPLPPPLPRPSRGLAVAMGMHPRLGGASPVAGLDSDLLRSVHNLTMRYVDT